MVSDIELVKLVQDNNCEKSILELINRHTPICHKIINKFEKTFREMGIDVEELALENPIIIYHCAKNFDPTKKAKFSSWLANNIKYNCLNLLYKRKNTISIDDEEIGENILFIPDDKESNKEKKEYVFSILSQMKDSRLEKIIEMRYFGDKESKKWKNIAKSLNTSYMTVSILHKKALRFLKSKFQSKNLSDFV